jgi:hypothetical protein
VLRDQEDKGSVNLGANSLLGFCRPTHDYALEHTQVEQSCHAWIKNEQPVVAKVLDGQIAGQEKGKNGIEHQTDEVCPTEQENIFRKAPSQRLRLRMRDGVSLFLPERQRCGAG